jgi:coatomer subunit gamma
LKFEARDCDPDSGVVDDVAYSDEYQPENFDVFTGDYMLPTYIPSFQSVWNEMGNLVSETFALAEIKTVKDAINFLQIQLGMKVMNDNVKEGTRVEVFMGGTFVGGHKCIANVKMVINPTNGVTMQLNVKSNSHDLSYRIANSIQ